MDMRDEQSNEPETVAVPVTPAPAAMPLSMPPNTARMADVPSSAEVPITQPQAAMPLSMPPTSQRAADEITTEYPTGAGSGGTVPPIARSWATEVPWPSMPSAAAAPETSERSRRGLAALVAATVLAGGLGAGLGVGLGGGGGSGSDALSSAAKAPSPTKALSVSAIYKLAAPAVVDVNTLVAGASSEGGTSEAAGTGMIVSSNGVILTNNHVIKNALKIEVSISGHAKTYSASVLGTSVKNDIALIKVNGLSDLPTVTFGDSSTVQIGDTAVAIGNEQGLGGSPSTAAGSISALGRTINAADESGPSGSSETLTNLIETNAQIEPGDSGGPLLNAHGQVIGIDTAASSSDTASSLGFAIPINQAKAIALAIEQGKATAANGVHVGLTPYFGVYFNNTNANGFGNFGFGGSSTSCSVGGSAPTSGVTIADVATGGPAARSGITGGDTITAVGGKAIANSTALKSVINALRPGQKVNVRFVDGCGTTHTTSITTGGVPA